MRTRHFALVGLAAALVMAAAPAELQTPDFASSFTPAVTLGPVGALAGNTARTGSWVSRAGYQSLAAVVTAGHVVEATTARRYAVLQDSIAGSAVAAVDSVQLDTVDNVAQKIRYTGTRTHVRILIRAGSGAGDSAYTSAHILLAHQRRRT